MTIIFFLLTLLGFTVYSYSQIDLNLTLLQTPWFLTFQNFMIQLGYYQRPLSAAIFTVLLLVLYFLYFKLWKLEIGNPLRLGRIEASWKLAIGFIGILSVLAYPFLSHDIFNYMFDAKIVTTYGQNPYFFKALDFPADTWLRFMHWTHRTYPYGPIWLLATLVPSFLGFGKFILTLLNFKLLFLACYLANSWLVYKLAKLEGLKLFALNPLIVLETLYSPHNEALMLTFLLLSIYLGKLNRKIPRLLSLLLSAGTKYLTIVLIPVRDITLSLWLLFFAILFVVFTHEPYPWYLVTFIGLAALLPQNKKLHYFLAAISLGTLLRYVPYLYVGDYSPSVQQAKNLLTVIPVAMISFYYVFKK